MKDSSLDGAETVLVLAPTFSDSKAAVEVLAEANIDAESCSDLRELCVRMRGECGAVILSEEGISDFEDSCLRSTLEAQPPWSDIPIILLTSSEAIRFNERFPKIGNVSLLERPFSKLTLVRAIEVALRARRKQYDIRELLEALKRSKDEADRANLSKTQFLANVSHEIRTPLGAILGFTDLLKNPTNSAEENLHYMGVVERNSQQLLRLIDDILDLSKVEAGKMLIETIQFSLAEMLADFISIMGLKAEEKGVEFIFESEGLFPNVISSDPVRLRQILTNIVANAFKFTDKGNVHLTVSYSNPILRFLVKDTGLGISKEQGTRLFQPFAQADSSIARKFGGTGLGLVLSRRLAENLGGKLELVESQVKVGSTFLIEVKTPLLPHAKLIDGTGLADLAKPIEVPQSRQALRGLSVLVVEDSPDNQKLVTAYLKREGALVQSAYNGAQGVELALREDFDLLLMDLRMPVLDGHEAAKKLRQCQYSKPIIALTAHAMKEERSRCFESGFTDFLTKPIQRELLIGVLARYMQPQRTALPRLELCARKGS
jgi:signal transduction histidine kinase/ActR/RegA family two-component response regulator